METRELNKLQKKLEEASAIYSHDGFLGSLLFDCLDLTQDLLWENRLEKKRKKKEYDILYNTKKQKNDNNIPKNTQNLKKAKSIR